LRRSIDCEGLFQGNAEALMNLHPKRLIAVAVLMFLAVVSSIVARNRSRPLTTPYSQFLQQVQDGKVARVIIIPANTASPVTYTLKRGDQRRTVLPSHYRDALAAMQASQVEIEIQESPAARLPLLNAAPFLLLLALWVVLLIWKRKGPAQLLS